MKFDIQKFLVKNKLTKRSLLNEDDNTGAVLKTDAEQDEMSDEEEFGDEEGSDDWHKAEPDNSDEFEKEPSTKDVKKDDVALNGIHKKQAELKALENQKDALLMQLRSGQLSLDQYKQSIGNIPADIKNLRADIEKAMNVSIDDDSEDQS